MTTIQIRILSEHSEQEVMASLNQFRAKKMISYSQNNQHLIPSSPVSVETINNLIVEAETATFYSVEDSRQILNL
jgi:hypothetical protein